MLVAGGRGVARETELYNPATGLWALTGELGFPRDFHTATSLPNGKVIVVGGSGGGGSSAELYNPALGSWSATGALRNGRIRHTATLLLNGKLLAAGGSQSGFPQTSAELYDPALGNWTPTGPLAIARESHTATLLPDGRVLVAGGIGAGADGSAEIYDPSLGTWTAAANLGTPRRDHTATLLPNGKVLLAGGTGAGNNSLFSAELYNPALDAWTPTGDLNAGRPHHTAILLPNGKVLVVAGLDGGTYIGTAEIYDPQLGTWSPAPGLNTPRYDHTTTLLLDGRILVAGGFGTAGFLASSELYDLGLGFDNGWRPQIATFHVDAGLDLTGSLFQGISQASSGNTQESSTNYPLVQLRNLESSQVAFLLVDPMNGWSDTSFASSALVAQVSPGPSLVTVFTNGIPSISKYLLLGSLIGVEQPAGMPLVNDATVDFGNVLIGNSATRTFTITNSGSHSLSGIVITVDGTHGSAFTVDTTSTSSTVAHGMTTTFDLSFQSDPPPGARTAALHIATNDPLTPIFNVHLTANSTAPLPITPGTPDLQAGSDSGSSSSDNVTNDTTPSFNISGVLPEATVDLFRDGTVVATGTSDCRDVHLLSDSAVTDGIHKYKARQTKLGATSPDSAELSVTIDTAPPTFSNVPANITGEATGSDGATIGYTAPTATDSVSGAVTVSCLPASGALFPLGATIVTCSTSDAAGNEASATFSVTVRDTTPPVFQDVTANVLEEATGPGGAAVTYTAPTAIDVVSGNLPVDCMPASGATFALGVTEVTCEATDEANNTATATFDVEVEDTTPPAITAPDDIIVHNQSGVNGASVSFSATANDLVDGAITVTANPASGSIFPIGKTTVNLTAQDDAGNEASAAFIITVRRTELVNISTRIPVGTGDEVGIGGFIIRGNDPLPVLIRALGPSLNVNGTALPGRLADPVVELFNQQKQSLAQNDNWQSTQQNEINATGLAPTNANEAAIFIQLPPGAYTAVVSGANGTTGNALVEIFALLSSSDSKLDNISTRGLVQTGSNVLIGGLISRGGDPTRVLIRAVGPVMAAHGVANTLQNPTLSLHDGNGVLLKFNDDWQDTQGAEIQATGMAPSNPQESAIVATLGAGPHTAVVRGKDNTTGVALVEAYALP